MSFVVTSQSNVEQKAAHISLPSPRRHAKSKRQSRSQTWMSANCPLASFDSKSFRIPQHTRNRAFEILISFCESLVIKHTKIIIMRRRRESSPLLLPTHSFFCQGILESCVLRVESLLLPCFSHSRSLFYVISIRAELFTKRRLEKKEEEGETKRKNEMRVKRRRRERKKGLSRRSVDEV